MAHAFGARVKLGDICHLVNGDAYKEALWSTKGTPIIRIQNLNDASKPFNYWAGPLDDRVRVTSGDVLLAWSGTPGTSFGAHIWTRGEGVLNQHIFRVDLDKAKADPEWIVFAVNQELDQLIDAAHGGVGLRHVTRGQVENLLVHLPPLPTQRRIAAQLKEQLAEIDRARTAQQSQLEAAKALPASSLRGVFSDGSRESGSATGSSHWPMVSLGKVCGIVARQVDPKLPEYSILPHVNGENMASGTRQLLNIRSAAEDGMTSGKYLFEAGDVLYSKLRPYLRKVAVVDFRGVCSADMYPLRPDKALLDPDYMAWMLVSDGFTRYAVEESQRARMPKINRGELFAWTFKLPPLPVQRTLATRLRSEIAAATELRVALEAKLATLDRLPAALLRQVFGEVSQA